MSEEDKKTDAGKSDINGQDDSTSKKESGKEHLIPKERLDAEIAKKNEYKLKLDELLSGQEKAKESALKEQGKFKELAEKNATKAKSFDDLTKWVEEQVEAERSAIPKDKLDLIPEGLKGREFLAYIRKPKVQEMLFGSKKKPVDKGSAPDNQQGEGDEKITWSYLNSTSFQEKWQKMTPEEQMRLRNLARQNASKGLR